MTYLETISKTHDLVCQAKNLLDELATDLRNDTDVDAEVDHLILDLMEDLENVEDSLFSGCNIDHINDLPEKLGAE
jgi:tRNA A58 N-methylase Trm61